MANNFCPYLGICDEDGTHGPAQDYPSFENQCFAVTLIDPHLDGLESRDQLLLADQATYCLGNGHQLCPRFRFLHAAEDRAVELAAGINGSTSFDGESDIPPYVDPALLDDLAYGYDDPEPGPRLGVWVGIASLFFVFLLCGGSLATYIGWQMVGRGLVPFTQHLGQMTDLPERDPVFVLVTETPASAAVRSPLSTPAAVASHNETSVSEPTPTFEFPKAVSPTPVVDSAQANPVVITTPTPSEQVQDAPAQTEAIGEEAPAAPDLATAVAGPVVITTPGLATPTRRPTPVFVVPTRR